MKRYIYLTCLCFFMCHLVNAQEGIASVSNFYVHNNATGKGVMIHDNYHIKSIIKTNRLESANAITFGENSSWLLKESIGFIDGSVTSNVDSDFVFPVGHNLQYSPLGLSKSKASTVSYNQKKPDIKQGVNDSIFELIDAIGHWTVASKNTSKVSLYISENVSVNEKLAVIGLGNGQWSVVPSKMDSITFNSRASKLSFSGNTNESNGKSITTLEAIDLAQYKAFSVVVLTGESLKAKVEEKIVSYKYFKSIHFPFNDKNLTRYSKNLLTKLVREFPSSAKIKLVGNTDFYGASEYNYNFGMERATTIKSFLERNGINNVEIELHSEGENNPKIDCENCSSKETILNRRVDIYIVD